MDKAALIEKLNEAIAVELCGLLQYNQYAQVLTGQDRKVWEDFFAGQSDEAFAHAKKFASRVVALGGTPCCEPEPVKQTTDVDEMLRNSLDLERKAVHVYTEALGFCEDNAGYRNLLEDQIDMEVQDCEELEKYLGQIEPVAAQKGGQKKRTA